MKRFKIVVAVLLCLSAAALSGCGAGSQQQEESVPQQNEVEQDLSVQQDEAAPQSDEAAPQSDEVEQVETEPEAQTEEKILVAYFTWADNTYVEDPSQVDVDATTSASVLAPGNVGRMANWIHEEIGGDLFSIQVEDKYSSDYDECLDRASEENGQNARPALATHVENMDQYETIYIGYPNWWYSCPMALLSFLEEYDFSGKHIVLFCSHGTGGLSGSVDAITEVLPEDCTVEENVLGVYRPEVADSQDAVLEWLQEVQ